MQTMNIYVGNLDYQLTEDNLKIAFQAYGEVESVKILTDRDTGRSKGFGFVEMPEKEEALKAIEVLNGTELGGKTITVNEARPRPVSNNQRSGFGGGGRSKAGGGRHGRSSGGGGRNRF
jgi:RNA recognition motif-containing protein